MAEEKDEIMEEFMQFLLKSSTRILSQHTENGQVNVKEFVGDFFNLVMNIIKETKDFAVRCEHSWESGDFAGADKRFRFKMKPSMKQLLDDAVQIKSPEDMKVKRESFKYTV